VSAQILVRGRINNMQKFATAALALCMVLSAHSAELIDGGKLVPIKYAEPIPSGSTIGGYPIYPGDGKWIFTRGSTSTSTRGTQMASLQMSQYEGADLLATQIVDVTTSTGDGAMWAGSPCAGNHLYVKNNGSGRVDHCLTMDAVAHTVGDKAVTMFLFKVTHSSSASRFYSMTLLLNPYLLGYRGTGPADWGSDVLQVQTDKKAFVDKLSNWGEKLLDASMNVIDFSKPQDVYGKIPSFKTLLPVPAAYADAKFGMGFLSVLDDLKHRPGFAAVAYSPTTDYKTRHGWQSGAESQAVADKKAMENCESGRLSTSPPCKLVNLVELGITTLLPAQPSNTPVAAK
jgi:hypothetical protein